jgi:hypothetical protein
MNRKARRKAQAAARKRLGWEDRLEKYLDTSDGENIRRFARVTHQAGCPQGRNERPPALIHFVGRARSMKCARPKT